MNDKITKTMVASIKTFRLPRYREITDVGLYLEQTAKFINGYLAPLGGPDITTSMISNYVKQGILQSPQKKQYGADHIASLIFIATAKIVLSMDNIRMLFELRSRSYTIPTAYDYFCDEFENVLQYIFGIKDTVDNVGNAATAEKTILRNTIIAAAHKIYLDKYLEALKSTL